MYDWASSHHTSMTTYWGRLAMTLVALPMIIMSCGTAPQVAPRQVPPRITSTPATHPQAYFHFLRGYLAELEQESPRALDEYRQGLKYDPNSAYLKLQIANLYFASGEMSAAVNIADQISTDQLNENRDFLRLAKIYAGTGHYDRAIALYDQAIQLNSPSLEPYIAKGILLISLKRLDEAKEVFGAGLQKIPYSPESHFYLALIAKEEDQRDEAEIHFQETINQRPEFERAYRGLASLYEDHKESDKAIGVYEGFLESVNPHHKEFRLQLVRLHIRAKSYDQALNQLNLILADNPDDLNAQVRKAFILGEMGNYQQAAKDLNQILHARPNELRVRDFLGLVYEEMDDHAKAIQAYKTNLEIDPTFFDSTLHLGFLSYRLKRYEEAVSYLKQATNLNPKRSEPYLLLGLTYMQTEQYHLAVKQFQAGVQQDPTNADLHFNLGTAYDKLNEFEEFVGEMEEALRLQPKHADALNYLGYSYADRGVRIDQALDLTQRAVQLKPENGYYMDSLGWALFKMGRLEDALQTIQRALTLVSDDPVIFEHLGEIYLKLEEREKAKDAWSRSIKLDSSNERLIKRFRDQGFGEPSPEKASQPTLPKISQRPIDAH